MLVFPPSITKYLQLDAEFGASDVVVRFKNATGPDRVRRRTTASARPLRGTMTLSKAEWVLLEEFFEDTTAGGSEQFEWRHPFKPEEVAIVRFTAPPTYKPLHSFQIDDGDDVPYVLVTLSLELLPAAVNDGTGTPTVSNPPTGPDLLALVGIPAIYEDEEQFVAAGVVVFEGTDEPFEDPTAEHVLHSAIPAWLDDDAVEGVSLIMEPFGFGDGVSTNIPTESAHWRPDASVS